MDAKITYIFPSRSRPEKFFAALTNIGLMSAKHNYEIIATLDSDDETMSTEVVKRKFKDFHSLSVYYSNSTGKVDAINKNVDKIPKDTDIIILMSDDMVFTVWGFDDIIRTDMQQNFADYDGVLHYPDGSQVQDRIITLSILGKKYFDRFGYLYNPEYTSLWCDYEFSKIAVILGKYKYFPNTKIFRHAHPLWEKQPYDELMTKNESYYHSDQKIFMERQERNFDLP